jgi:adenylate kinase
MAFRLGGSDLVGNCRTPVVDFPIRGYVIVITASSIPVAYIQTMDPSKNGNRAAWLQGPNGHCEDRPQEMVGPWRLVLLGAPGVGKGTQADLLHQRLGACHLSTGDVFRAAGSQPECNLSPAMREALQYMRRGELVPDSTVWEMVRERKGCLHCGGGFILDGFPRTLAQAESLEKLLKYEEISLTAVVSYELSAEEVVARLSGRRTCEKCKGVYHIASLPPKVDSQCDRCGGKLFQREDDRPESIKVRLEAYERSTKPLLDFYEKSELLRKVAATGSPEEIYQRTIFAINTRHVTQCAEQLWTAAENRR